MSNSHDPQKVHDDKATLHEYDGIQELDNSLPGWWLGLFYLCIAFAVVYFGYYVLGGGPTLTQEYLAEKANWQQLQSKTAAPSSGGALDDAGLIALAKNAARVKSGQSVYMGKCLACHGKEGQGGIGPNLVDDHWIHGGKPTQIVKVITDGVNDKGMPPWGPQLKPEEIQDLFAFIRSIRGTHPAGAKAPQGEVYKE
jgi:cytochrome c oxidase cbb3-type subunit 3